MKKENFFYSLDISHSETAIANSFSNSLISNKSNSSFDNIKDRNIENNKVFNNIFDSNNSFENGLNEYYDNFYINE